MSVFVERSGDGPDLVLLHGWGLHGGLFAAVTPLLAARFRVHAVDLPGHGRSTYDAGAGLDSWAGAVAAAVPERAAWLGWSLGGLVALRTALDRPERVARLLLVATTPRFVAAPDWPHGQAPATFARFAAGLGADLERTVADFLTLQALGDDDARAQVRALRPQLFAHGEPDPRALADGLAILRDTDLRAELPRLAVPTLVIAGARDRLTPPQAAQALAALVPDAQLETVGGAAHMPFLHRPADFAARTAAFAGG